jgi:protoporphyrinogen/coproporphyrinogen III oxidase
MGGIYAGDANRLSLNATFPQLRQLELTHGSLMRGVMRSAAAPALPSPSAGGARRWTGFVSLRGGMGDLVDALTTQLAIDFQPGRDARAIERDADGWRIQSDERSIHADAIIVTTPAYVTAALLANVDARLAEAHRAIPHVSTATISFAYPRDQLAHPLHGFGFVIPSVERRRILACTWSSNKFPQRAPDGVVLVRCFIGRAGQEQLLERDDHALIQIARDELKATLQIEAEPLLTKIFHWQRGMPQYNLGHSERVAHIESALQQQPGLFVAGAAYRGVGIPDCIRSADQAAVEVLKFLDRQEQVLYI